METEDAKKRMMLNKKFNAKKSIAFVSQDLHRLKVATFFAPL